MVPLLALITMQSRVVELQTLDLSPMTNGWSRPRVNASIQGTPLTIGGRKFAKGIGAHANSRLNILLDHPIAFDATVGVDDETAGKGSVEFIVMVDGTVKWKSGIMKGGDAGKDVHLELAGAGSLSLLATDVGDGSGYDHADWGAPRLTVAGTSDPLAVRDLRPIRIETNHAALTLFVDDEGHLFQRAFGARSADSAQGVPAYPAYGDGFVFEPALEVTHADGNTSTDLRVTAVSQNGPVTLIDLKDPAYPFHVQLRFVVFRDTDVIEASTRITHSESGPVVLKRFASSSPSFGTGPFYLTQFQGDWGNEMNLVEEPLGVGIKTIDSKLGVRANQFTNGSFLLSKGGPAREDSGEVFGGALAWSGSFAITFERPFGGSVRALCGMNPFASEYRLRPGESFQTPPMVWGWSGTGTGTLSRNLHRWARANALRDGGQTRDILLNNWEATYFDFDARKIISLFDGAKALGIEMFLLDDGWFGVKYPRNDDTQGLGDWTSNPNKLPHGLGELTDAVKAKGIRFGLWLEPEMVNPKSELFEKHPNWAIQQPKRPLDLQRNQLVLDLANPEVEAYAYSVLDRTLRENPGISYVKWDCNRYLTQPGSPSLGANQSHLQIDYGRALYRIMDRLAREHPKVEIMICSGGGGRVDYGSLKYAHEYWPSDQTDPAHRIFIQWGYSFFFPVMASANHVTLSGGHGMKFAFDVAMSGRLGMDVDVDRLSPENKAFATSAITAYKSIRDVVQLGDLYRLESPYAGPRSSLMFVRDERAVVFAYSLGDVAADPLKLQGLNPSAEYQIREIDLGPGKTGEWTRRTGAELMQSGLPIPALAKYGSAVFELKG